MPVMANPVKHPTSGIYYLRIAVPDDLRASIGKSEIKKSLGSRNFTEAKQLFLAEYTKVLALFEQHRQQIKLTPKDIEVLATRWLESALEEMEREGNYTSYLTFEPNPNGRRGEGAQWLTGALESALDSGYDSLRPLFEDDVDKLLTDNQVGIPKHSEPYQALIHKVAVKSFKLYQAAEKRYRNDWSQDDSHLSLKGHQLSIESNPVVTERSSSPTLSKVFEQWKEELLNSVKGKGSGAQSKANNHIREYTRGVNRFIGFFGDMHIDRITRKVGKEFHSWLFKLPDRPRKNISKLPYIEQTVKAAELGLTTIGAKTVKNNSHAVSAVLTYAVDAGVLEFNPVLGMVVKGARKASGKRKDFTIDELEAIFSSPIFVEGIKPGNKDYGEAMFWLPLMAYYTGARREELAQLRVTDIQSRDGIGFIHIQEFDEGNKVKTGDEREVPIHADLIELGLLAYIEGLSQKCRLFPLLEVDADGLLGENVGRSYKRNVLNGLGIDKQPLHGFRHTFKTLCREEEIATEVHNAITGHSDSNVGEAYGSKTLKAMAKAIARFPSIPVDLSKLKRPEG